MKVRYMVACLTFVLLAGIANAEDPQTAIQKAAQRVDQVPKPPQMPPIDARLQALEDRVTAIEIRLGMPRVGAEQTPSPARTVAGSATTTYYYSNGGADDSSCSAGSGSGSCSAGSGERSYRFAPFGGRFRPNK